MQAILSWLGKFLLDWVYGKAVILIKFIYEWIKEKSKRDELTEERKKRARTVEEISAEIRQLLSEGKEVPDDLKLELRNASSKLINYNLD